MLTSSLRFHLESHISLSLSLSLSPSLSCISDLARVSALGPHTHTHTHTHRHQQETIARITVFARLYWPAWE